MEDPNQPGGPRLVGGLRTLLNGPLSVNAPWAPQGPGPWIGGLGIPPYPVPWPPGMAPYRDFFVILLIDLGNMLSRLARAETKVINNIFNAYSLLL